MRTLLIVDDDDDFREMLRIALGTCGFTVLAADSGERALAIAQAHDLDGVLTDYQMPNTDGVELCRAIRDHQIARGHEIPVWLMTGSVELSPAKALSTGARGFFKKPFRASHIATAIHQELDAAAPQSAA